MLGLIGAMYALGVSSLTQYRMASLADSQAIVSVPFVPIIADRFGRRRCTQLGCIILLIGAGLRKSVCNHDDGHS